MSEENLVSPPPRDSLILLRQDIRMELAAERNKNKQKSALHSYYIMLNHFSDRFFSKSGVFHNLTPAQKDELAKLCASFCKKRIAIISSPYAAILAWIMFSGTTYHWTLFFILVPWSVLTAIGFLWSRWADYVEFLWAKKIIEKLGKEVKPGEGE